MQPQKVKTRILALVSVLVRTLSTFLLFAFFKVSDTSRTVRQSHLKNLRAKNYQGTDDEWTQIVLYIFRQPVTSNGKPEWTSGIETSASISGSDDDEDNKQLVITIRKRIQTITVCVLIYSDVKRANL